MVRDSDPVDVSSYLCEAYFQAKRRWRKFTGRPTRRRRFINRRQSNDRGFLIFCALNAALITTSKP
eukprot:2820984-Prorocentrum_lima.AAC.1